MKITAQDLLPLSTLPPRQTSPRRWSPLLAIAVIGGLFIGALALGVLTQAPRFEIASAWQQSKLPMLYLDVEFKDEQLLKTDLQNARASGVHLARPGEAVSATIRLGNERIPVQVNLPAGPSAFDAWAFEITLLDQRGVWGWRHLLLYEAASRQALSQWGLSESLRREGILSASGRPVQMIFNGDALGVYSVGPAPDALAVQNRLNGGLVYFDQTLYWRDLRRQRGSGTSPTSINLSDCQVATVATVNGSDANAALARLRDLQTGVRKPSDVLDVEQMGTLLALSALWQDAPLGDWARLMFYQDASSGRLRPAAMANLISASGSGVLRWPACFEDPVIQVAYVRALERVSQPDYLQQLRLALGDWDHMRLVFTSQSGKPELTWDDLAARQKRIARWLEPTQMVLADWIVPPASSLKPTSVLSVSLFSLQRVPVEVLGFDVGKSTFLPIDPAWIRDGFDLVISQSKGSVILRAADEARLRALRLNVPYTAVFGAERAGQLDEPVEIRVVTRLWGLARQHSAPMQRVQGE